LVLLLSYLVEDRRSIYIPKERVDTDTILTRVSQFLLFYWLKLIYM
jgi:hypothetical protein